MINVVIVCALTLRASKHLTYSHVQGYFIFGFGLVLSTK